MTNKFNSIKTSTTLLSNKKGTKLAKYNYLNFDWLFFNITKPLNLKIVKHF